MNGASLETATWPEINAAPGSERILLVPLGATEQHGPHLPLGVDSTIAKALADAVAARIAAVVVAPVLAYGASGEHEDFPGTVSIGADALELVLVELCRSAGSDFARIVLLSAHGGNAEPVARAVARLSGEGRRVESWSPSWGGDAHAGATETSLMLALAPDQVRMTLAEPGNARPLAELMGGLRSRGVRAVSPNGVLGDPEGASAANGRRLLAAAVEDLCALLASRQTETTEVRA